MSEQVHETTDQRFKEDVIQNRLPVLVDFWAPWCGHCRMMAPILDQISQEFDGKVAVKKINVDENEIIAGAMKISGIPTLVLFNQGRPVKKWVGLLPQKELSNEISALTS